MERIVLAIRREHADALLDGTATVERRTVPPKRLPARAYLAVVGTRSVAGECVLGPPTGRSGAGWALPVTRARRYRRPRPVGDYGLTKVPRSFRYV